MVITYDNSGSERDGQSKNKSLTKRFKDISVNYTNVSAQKGKR